MKIKKILILTSPSIIKKTRVRKLIRGLIVENNVDVPSAALGVKIGLSTRVKSLESKKSLIDFTI